MSEPSVSPEAARLREAVAAVPFWWHAIDLGHDVIAPGHKTPEVLAREWESLALGNLAGKSVLDIGAWDGFFSFAAERAGAERVVALDYYAWGATRQDAHIRGREAGVANELQIDTLPGRAAFDLARRELSSGVEPVVSDFLDLGPDDIGSFDVVLFLGVLYHLEDPLGALRHLRRLTRGVALIETAAVVIPGRPEASLWEFYPGNELLGDPTNWWAPTPAALEGACRAAGFATTRVLFAGGEPTGDPGELVRIRAIVRAEV